MSDPGSTLPQPGLAKVSLIYEEAVDEYLALVNGPLRLVGDGRISPPVERWHVEYMLDSNLDPLKPGFQDPLGVVAQQVIDGLLEGYWTEEEEKSSGFTTFAGGQTDDETGGER